MCNDFGLLGIRQPAQIIEQSVDPELEMHNGARRWPNYLLRVLVPVSAPALRVSVIDL